NTSAYRLWQRIEQIAVLVGQCQTGGGAHTTAFAREVFHVISDFEQWLSLSKPRGHTHHISVTQRSGVATTHFRDEHPDVELHQVRHVQVHGPEKRAARYFKVLEVVTVPHDTKRVAVVKRDLYFGHARVVGPLHSITE